MRRSRSRRRRTETETPPPQPAPMPAPNPDAEPASAAAAWRARQAESVDPLLRRWSSGPSARPRTIRTPCSTRSAATRAGRTPSRCSPDVDAARRRGPTCCATRSTTRTARAGWPRAARPNRRPTISREAPRRSWSRSASGRGRDRRRRGGDTGGLVERIGARLPRMEEPDRSSARSPTCSAMAWSRGVYDAVARRRGAVVDPARAKAGAPTATTTAGADGEGRAFPTGQPVPPRIRAAGACSLRPKFSLAPTANVAERADDRCTQSTST